MRTEDHEYAVRLLTKQTAWWKKAFDVQAPYRWNLRRLQPGFTLEIGCGIGRNLQHLDGNGVGIDHNPYAVEIARSRGLQAFTEEDFLTSSFKVADRFDSILLSHVAEHMTEREVIALLELHVHLLKPNGQLIFVTPQEVGFRSDPTHVQFVDFSTLRRISGALGFTPRTEFSFPFPRPFGRLFKYNEFICVCKRVSQPTV